MINKQAPVPPACACCVPPGGAGGPPYGSRLGPYDPDQGSQLGSYNAGYDGSQPNLAPPIRGSQNNLGAPGPGGLESEPRYGSQPNLEPDYGSGSQSNLIPGSQQNLGPPYGSQDRMYDRRTPSPYSGSQRGPEPHLRGDEPMYGSQLGSMSGSQTRLGGPPPFPGSQQSGSQQLPPYAEEDVVDRAVAVENMAPMVGMFGAERAPSSGSINRGQGLHRHTAQSKQQLHKHKHNTAEISARGVTYLTGRLSV